MILLRPTVFDQFREWELGSLSGRGQGIAATVAPFVGVGLLVAVALGRPLNAIALGEETGRDLEERHAAAVGRTQEPDLDERQPELRRPHGQKDVDDVREAVVKHVGAARHPEDGPAGGLHAPIIAGRAVGFK